MKTIGKNIRYFPFYPVITFVFLLIKNKEISFRKLPLVFVYLLRFTLLEPLRLIELILFENRVNKIQLKHPPIFILGHWRSGTSYLQDLLCQNPSYSTYTVFRFLFSDIFLVTETWLKKPLNAFIKFLKLPYSFQRVPLDLDISGEMEVAMCSIFSLTSYTWGHIFPHSFNQYTERWIYSLSDTDEKKWINDYDYLIKKLAFQSNNNQVVVKSPGDTGRVEQLLRKYPNAKFIYIERDPIKVFLSNRYLWSAIQKENSVQLISAKKIDEIVFKNYTSLIHKYQTHKKHVPPNQLIEINYDELNKEPKQTLKKIYKHLQLLGFPEKETQRFIEGNSYYATSTYNLPEELEFKIKTRWAFAFKKQQE